MKRPPTPHKGTAPVPLWVPFTPLSGSLSCTLPSAHKGTIFYISEGTRATA
jgi:hypothetical protein